MVSGGGGGAHVRLIKHVSDVCVQCYTTTCHCVCVCVCGFICILLYHIWIREMFHFNSVKSARMGNTCARYLTFCMLRVDLVMCCCCSWATPRLCTLFCILFCIYFPYQSTEPRHTLRGCDMAIRLSYILF